MLLQEHVRTQVYYQLSCLCCHVLRPPTCQHLRPLSTTLRVTFRSGRRQVESIHSVPTRTIDHDYARVHMHKKAIPDDLFAADHAVPTPLGLRLCVEQYEAHRILDHNLPADAPEHLGHRLVRPLINIINVCINIRSHNNKSLAYGSFVSYPRYFDYARAC